MKKLMAIALCLFGVCSLTACTSTRSNATYGYPAGDASGIKQTIPVPGGAPHGTYSSNATGTYSTEGKEVVPVPGGSYATGTYNNG